MEHLITRESVIERIEAEQLIVILRGIHGEELRSLVGAIHKGGVNLVECTFDATGKYPAEKTAEDIRMLVETYGDEMLFGAGTVLSEEQVVLTKAAGGRFIISPDTNPDIIRKTRELQMVSIPGALTPSEITAAHRAGADFVKLFPVSTMGADYVKAVKAPLSHVRLLAVGGIRLDNMEEYRKAGACGFGIGSNFASKDALKNGDWDAITAGAKAYVDSLRG